MEIVQRKVKMGRRLKHKIPNSKYSVGFYQGMLRYMRPQGSVTQQIFCDKYLKPVFGDPDIHGNYSIKVGDSPEVVFTSHHDTVHKYDGLQDTALYWHNDEMYINLSKNEKDKGRATCLGADCTTGIFIMLCMIEADIPGLYVVHSAEEVGGHGSTRFVDDNEKYLKDYSYVISFDRYGQSEIITHQGFQTASKDFALSLNGILGGGFVPSSGGLFTDSANYVDVVKDCTNIAVGYSFHHTKNEKQNVTFMFKLIEKLLKADWSKLYSGEFEPYVPTFYNRGKGYYDDWESRYFGESSATVLGKDSDTQVDDTKPYSRESPVVELYDILDFVANNEFFVAEVLHELGYSVYDLEKMKKDKRKNVTALLV